jgi:hypothetical protein
MGCYADRITSHGGVGGAVVVLEVKWFDVRR